MPSVPDVRYARSGNVAIAYQTYGEGTLDLVFIRGTLAELLTAWEQPLWVRHVDGLASIGRVIMFDKRGTGLSDRVREVPTLEARMDDVRAVLDDLAVDRVVLWTAQEGSRLAILFAATYPERTRAIVLYNPTVHGVRTDEYPWARTEEEWVRELREAERRWGDRAYLVERLKRDSPTVAHDPEFQEWYVRYMRRSASPDAAAAFLRMEMMGDVERPWARSRRRRSSAMARGSATRRSSSRRRFQERAWSRSRAWGMCSAGPTQAQTTC
jgi:pimeloyl-ACP methyl ester carboxylesterase